MTASQRPLLLCTSVILITFSATAEERKQENQSRVFVSVSVCMSTVDTVRCCGTLWTRSGAVVHCGHGLVLNVLISYHGDLSEFVCSRQPF